MMNNQDLRGERDNSTSNIAATPVRQFNEREDNSSTASQIFNNTHLNMPYNSGAQIPSTTHTSAAMPSTYLEPAAHTQQYSRYPNHQYLNSYYNNEYHGSKGIPNNPNVPVHMPIIVVKVFVKTLNLLLS